MKKTSLAFAGALAVGLALAVALPANAASTVLYVPDDFEVALSDTRSTGHYELVSTGLRVYTDGTTTTDKVAEYVATSTLLATVGEPSLNFTNTSGGGTPGYQLLVDFDGDGTTDGILVGEPGSYGNDWWLNNAAEPFVKAAAPLTSGGSGSAYHGTLDQWRDVFANANVTAWRVALDGSASPGTW